VADFNLGYSFIIGWPFLIKFMAGIHSAYALMKMTGPEGVISVHFNLKDAISYDINSFALAGHFRAD
jgi:hypothetical protein